MSGSPRTVTAFQGFTKLAAGSPADVARVLRRAVDAGAAHLVVLDDETGNPIDLDLRENASRSVEARAEQPRRGRPRLGVEAREVTLLPRHWAWLAQQPGGASAALRRLVESALREPAAEKRRSRDAAWRAMQALAGDLPGFEEASRALFAGDLPAFRRRIDAWPRDVAAYVGRLASPSLD